MSQEQTASVIADQTPSQSLDLATITTRAERARAGYRWQEAIEQYTAVLALAGDDPAVRYALLDGRAECLRMRGNWMAELANLKVMADMAERLNDPARQAQVKGRQADAHKNLGDFAEAQTQAEAGLALARAAGDQRGEVHCLLMLADMHWVMGDFETAQSYAEQSLVMSRAMDDPAHEARSLVVLALIAARTGRLAETKRHAQAGLALYRSLADREGEVDALNALAIENPDVAEQRSYLEQALAIAEAMDSWHRGKILHNLGVVYVTLGLYRRGYRQFEESIDSGSTDLYRLYILLNLSWAAAGLGQFDEARRLDTETLRLARSVGAHMHEMLLCGSLGYGALMVGRYEEARRWYQQSVALAAEIDQGEAHAGNLAWLGAALLALGDQEAALQLTAQAVQRHLAGSEAASTPAQTSGGGVTGRCWPCPTVRLPLQEMNSGQR